MKCYKCLKLFRILSFGDRMDSFMKLDILKDNFKRNKKLEDLQKQVHEIIADKNTELEAWKDLFTGECPIANR